MLFTDKNFYIGIEQNFYWMNYLTDHYRYKKDLQQKEKEGTFFFQYEKGEASGNYVFENDLILVALQCTLKQEAFYTVSFRYRKRMGK